ncbi:YfaP family protein [Aureicoccus marinus]|uniref:YfaP family protein n=1 Tax=Aureicoccus marinus TaxID=754435 RepID=UPI0015E3A1B1|nr:TonB-dependent receptor plug domain-containing protein [Aureicoccus marinus]
MSEVSKEEEGTGYAVQSIGKEELTTVNTNLNSAVRGRFSGVTTGGGIQSGADQDLSRFIVRGQSSMLLNNYGLIVVDGVPIKQSNSSSSNFQSGDAIASTNFIDPALIEDITVLKGLAATNRFGSLGSNGVLLITTKTAVTKGKNGEIVDRARLTDNIYNENEALAKPQEAPFYQLLKAAQNPQEAYQTYSSLQELNKGNIAFYLESYDYFSKQNKTRSISVLTNILEYFPEDIKLLRTVEFYLSQAGYDQQARLVNDQILEISPSNLHAYYKRVMLPDDKAIQTQMETKYALLKGRKKFKEINAQPIQKTLLRDIKNFIEKNRAALNVNSIDSYLANNIRYDARFVFEWNNPEAEFELQFVNPQDRYYNWGYSRNEDAQRLNSGLINGYMLEEFEFYGKESIGKWIVNVKYLGNISEADQTPLVLKCVVYTDFGKTTEQKKEVVVHLSKRNQKQNVLEIVVN